MSDASRPPDQPGPNWHDPNGFGSQPAPQPPRPKAPLDPLALANELLAEMNPPTAAPPPPAPPQPYQPVRPVQAPRFDPLGLGGRDVPQKLDLEKAASTSMPSPDITLNKGNPHATRPMPAVNPPAPTVNPTQRMQAIPPGVAPANPTQRPPAAEPPRPPANTTQRMQAIPPAAEPPRPTANPTQRTQAIPPAAEPPRPPANTTQRMQAIPPSAEPPRPNVNTTQRMQAIPPAAEPPASPTAFTGRPKPVGDVLGFEKEPPRPTAADPWAKALDQSGKTSSPVTTQKMKAITPPAPPSKDVNTTQRMTALTPPPKEPTRDVNTTQKMTALGNVTRLMPAVDDKKGPPKSNLSAVPTQKIKDAKTQLMSKAVPMAPSRSKSRSGVKTTTFWDYQVMRLRRIFDRRERISTDEVVVFTRQFSAMVTAGLQLHQSLYFYAEADTLALNRVVHEVADKVGEGNSLSHAMRRYPEVFSEVYTGLIAAGESTGMLSPVLSKLADLSEKNQNIRKKVWATLTYPMVLLTVSFGCVLAFLYFVLPMMVPLFTSLGVQLPWPTRLLILLSEVMKNPLVIASLTLGPISLWVLWPVFQAGMARDPERLRSFHRIPLGIPALGRMFEKIITARIMFSMATLLDAGYALNATLEKCEKVAGNAEIAWRLRRAREMLIEGCSAAECLQRANVFPNSAIQMIAVGEEAASLSDMIARVAKVYEDEVELTLMDFAALLEPMILIGMGLIVAFLVLAAVMPTVQLLNNF